ncbi:MAG: hypothetical protein CME61_05955 [Halobacteriovoraceae bacterium]|nr:hypothetical protein [Halobacteriovoraceae bacterium]
MKNKISINNSCKKSKNCAVFCPEDAIFQNSEKVFIDQSVCTECSICIDLCPENAISFQSSKEVTEKTPRNLE